MSSRRTRTNEGGKSTPPAPLAEAPVETPAAEDSNPIVEVTVAPPVVAGVSASAAAGVEVAPTPVLPIADTALPGAASSSKAKPLSSQPLDLATSEVLLKIYNKMRIDGQLDFYKSRIREYDANAGFMLGMSAIIMGASAFISAVGAIANNAGLALITTLLPALAALMASFRQLYQWEKQSVLYRDAMLGLEEARLVMPDDDLFDPRTSGVLLPKLVNTTEEVFIAEMNQWGQIAMGSKDEDEDEDDLNKLLRSLRQQDAGEVEPPTMAG